MYTPRVHLRAHKLHGKFKLYGKVSARPPARPVRISQRDFVSSLSRVPQLFYTRNAYRVNAIDPQAVLQRKKQRGEELSNSFPQESIRRESRASRKFTLSRAAASLRVRSTPLYLILPRIRPAIFFHRSDLTNVSRNEISRDYYIA